VIERLKHADREQIRALLSKYLRSEAVEKILERIDRLTEDDPNA
jgi:hypothetical protein